jgi:Cdc6-like AAA superfamily ATPase
MSKKSLEKVLKSHRTSETVQESPLDYSDKDYHIDQPLAVGPQEKYFCQYSIEQGSNFRPSSKTINSLPAGLYKALEDTRGMYFGKESLDMSELIRFPDSIADTVIDEFDTFWTKKDKYLDRGEAHKRGFLLWGPPGGGKTCTVSFIIQDFIKQGNVEMTEDYSKTKDLKYKKAKPLIDSGEWEIYIGGPIT